MLYLARSWSGEGDRITDPQLLASLAIAEAVVAARYLMGAIQKVYEDDDVVWWLHVAHRREYRRGQMRDAFNPNISAAVDKAALRFYFSEIPHVTRKLIHAEQLLLLAELRASGSIDADQVERMARKISEAENHRKEIERDLADEKRRLEEVGRSLEEVRERQRRGFNKASAAKLKIPLEEKKLIAEKALAMRNDGKMEKVIESELAIEYKVHVSTIQRALGKK